MYRLLVTATVLLLVYSCAPLSQKSLTKKFKEAEDKFQDHIGFALYDPGKKKMVYEYNSDKYFTPASNTKIFSFTPDLQF